MTPTDKLRAAVEEYIRHEKLGETPVEIQLSSGSVYLTKSSAPVSKAAPVPKAVTFSAKEKKLSMGVRSRRGAEIKLALRTIADGPTEINMAIDPKDLDRLLTTLSEPGSEDATIRLEAEE
jgi:hypothetical protein